MTSSNFQVRLPQEASNPAIHEEYFFLTQGGKERKLRLHDYDEIYQVPGLYEYLAFEIMNYQSPSVLSNLLIEQVTQAQQTLMDLRVLDFGAGSGLMGRLLADLGVKTLMGADIEPEAAQAAAREYPGVYSHYYTEDFTDLSPSAKHALESSEINCLVCCSALSHIPQTALSTAFNLIQPNGWLAFNVELETWQQQGADSFRGKNPWLDDSNIFNVQQQHPYLHRYYMDGRPLEYMAVIGRKQADIA